MRRKGGIGLIAAAVVAGRWFLLRWLPDAPLTK